MELILDQGLKTECFSFHQFNYFKIKGKFVFFSGTKLHSSFTTLG